MRARQHRRPLDEVLDTSNIFPVQDGGLGNLVADVQSRHSLCLGRSRRICDDRQPSTTNHAAARYAQ